MQKTVHDEFIMSFLIIGFQPAHNDKTAHPEVARLMKELIKSRKQLKGQLQKHTDRHGFCKMCPLSFFVKVEIEFISNPIQVKNVHLKSSSLEEALPVT